MQFNLLSLRTKFSLLSLKWNNLPHISNFNQYKHITECINTSNYTPDLEDCRIIGYILPNNPKYNIKPQCEQDQSIFLLTDMVSHIYISIGLSEPTLWYIVSCTNGIIDDIIIEEVYDIME